MSSREKIKSELLELAVERGRIIEKSTEKQLERIDLRSRKLEWRLQEENRKASSIRSNSKRSANEQELSAAIIDSMNQERTLITNDLRGILLDKFVRPDAKKHFRATLEAKKKEVDKTLSPFRNSYAKPGRRLQMQQDELAAMQMKWQDTMQTEYEVGENIFNLREERRRIQTELNGLRQEREEEALAAAGI